jgi:hypothetical protein
VVKARPPDFDDLVGPELGELERARLRQVHDALVAAGPPPDLPPALAQPPGRKYEAPIPALPRGYPRRRLAAALVLAAALALAAFGAGYLVGDTPAPAAFEQDFAFVMYSADSGSQASASVVVGNRDEGGNWPMIMTVRELDELPDDAHYELRLTRDGKPADSCGTFVVSGDKTVVYLNAPYRLRDFDGWVVTREGRDDIILRTEEI